MFGSLSEEVEVKVSADKAWQLYGSIKLGEIAAKHTLESIDVLEGDGGVGTIIKVYFKPVEVKVAADKAWQLYGTIKLPDFAAKHTFERLDIIEGDGGAGTIVKVTFKPEFGIPYCMEKYTMVDNDKMVKEVEIIEGGFLDFGFTLYRVRIEVQNNVNDDTGSSCVVKMTIEYEVKEEAIDNASLTTIEPFVVLMKIANEHLLNSA
ncbi:norbelladine synthase-like [Bidens hawaiensis]|uniref:norbelladine synthase-like n=1 Tax=Bidens hawaiensis TaxID=980011 RepID=UPI00404B25EA